MLFNQIEQLKSTLSSERAEALSQFLAAGFPTKKDEEYKYTDLSEAVNKQYSLAVSYTHLTLPTSDLV